MFILLNHNCAQTIWKGKLNIIAARNLFLMTEDYI